MATHRKFNVRHGSIEVGVDTSFAVGLVRETEGVWTVWLGPFYLFIVGRL